MALAVPECVYSEESVPFERHFHNAYELLYVVAGQIEIRIGKKVYTVSPHSLAFISKLEEHSVRVLEEPYRRYFLLIPSETLPQLVSEPPLRSVFINRPAEFNHVFPLERVAATNAIWPELVREASEQRPFAQLNLSSLLNLILIACYREHASRFSSLYQPVNPAIYHIRAHLEQHFEEPVSISALAEEYFLNPCYMTHLFTEAVGCSPKRYLMLNRIAKAKELLLHSKLSVQDISVQCGFNDANNFIRLFKRETGSTPRQYRDGYLQAEQTD